MSLLLSAAGILTVAIGFASQTSASNIISGLFLIGEKPFEIGEVIKIGDTTGEVISIDLLSVKLRTFDNLYVRIANENLIKSEITNLNRFPLRRVDLVLGLDYSQDLKQALEVLSLVAAHNPLCFEEPKPLFIFKGFSDSSVDLQFSVWARQENFLEVKNALHIEIKEAFDERGIPFPFPQRTVHMAAAGYLPTLKADQDAV
jgi:small-conductance mechanosensitive channel